MSQLFVNRRNDIQWLRAFAATEVALWHSDLVTKYFSPSTIRVFPYEPFGGIGVEIFFILSGYVICMQAPTYSSGYQFMLSRVYRIAPMYWIFTTLVIAAFLINPGWRLHGLEFDWSYLLSSYLLLPQERHPVLGVGWTLEHEMIFYAVAAVAMVLAGGLNLKVRVGTGLFLMALGWTGLIIGLGPDVYIWDLQLLSPFMLTFGFGWMMRLLHESGAVTPRLWFLTALIVGGAPVVLFASPETIELAFRFAVAAAVFVAVCALRPRFEANTAANRLMARVGDASYSIYLSHWFLLSISGKVLSSFMVPAWMDLPARVVVVTASIAAGYGIFALIEKPIDRYLRGSIKTSPPREHISGPARAAGV